ncbi:MAG: hypothetical protein HYZ48_05135, partial [Chlamydiales bacterium]|nr:hypothetical protein [Chlamydiales bacterium]
IVDEVFLKGKKEWHNFFYVGGNQDTLSIAMVRSIFPFLKAFIHRGEHA